MVFRLINECMVGKGLGGFIIFGILHTINTSISSFPLNIVMISEKCALRFSSACSDLYCRCILYSLPPSSPFEPISRFLTFCRPSSFDAGAIPISWSRGVKAG